MSNELPKVGDKILVEVTITQEQSRDVQPFKCLVPKVGAFWWISREDAAAGLALHQRLMSERYEVPDIEMGTYAPPRKPAHEKAPPVRGD